MLDTYTSAQVTDLLNTVLAGIRIGGAHEDRVFTLEQVADRTGWSLTTLKEDCRLNRIEHTRRGKAIGLTSSQIAKLVAAARSGADAPAAGTEAAEEDELAQVRASSRRGADRATSRRRGRKAVA